MIKCVACTTDNRDTARFCMKCSLRLPGTILQGRYKIGGLLGQGGMGAVYLVEDQSLFGTRWALKELSDMLLAPTERTRAVQQFQKEAQILLGLAHPNLPRISHYFAENGRQHLVMEYIDGETLEARWQASPAFLGEAQVVDWAMQICDVLEYLHGQNPPIIFRDLKPANIMLAKDGKIKLIDFGIARNFQPGKTQDTQAMGTPGYAAPEQYGGSGQTDVRSDVYALGATLHTLLTRRVPGTPPFVFPPCRTINSVVSAQMETVVAKATEYDRARRYQSMAEMKQALSPAAGKPPSAMPTGTGIVGPKEVKWSQVGPLRTLVAFCGVDGHATTWIEEAKTQSFSCTECATARTSNGAAEILGAVCNVCKVQTHWIISMPFDLFKFAGLVNATASQVSPTKLPGCSSCGVTGSPGAGFCENCGAALVQPSTGLVAYYCTCTCLGCGQQRVLEAPGVSSAMAVFCSQCQTKTPWLVYSEGRVCLWCGQTK